MTDTKLFISNDAAGVGISLLDPNARTIIIVKQTLWQPQSEYGFAENPAQSQSPERGYLLN